jgi:hypothetical protein
MTVARLSEPAFPGAYVGDVADEISDRAPTLLAWSLFGHVTTGTRRSVFGPLGDPAQHLPAHHEADHPTSARR